DAHAKRVSPPAAIDCSGSHWRTVPSTESVLTVASTSAPPTACTARLTRSTPAGGDVVAQDAAMRSTASSSAARFMTSSYRSGVGVIPGNAALLDVQLARDHAGSIGSATQDDELTHLDVAPGQIGHDAAVGDQHEWRAGFVSIDGLLRLGREAPAQLGVVEGAL